MSAVREGPRKILIPENKDFEIIDFLLKICFHFIFTLQGPQKYTLIHFKPKIKIYRASSSWAIFDFGQNCQNLFSKGVYVFVSDTQIRAFPRLGTISYENSSNFGHFSFSTSL